MQRCALAFLAVSLTLPSIAAALPIVSVDADPNLPGVQTTRSVELGDSFDVAISVEAVDAAHPLHAFELVLAHGDVLGGASVALGDFLGADAFLIPGAPSPIGVEIAAARLGPEGSAGAGVLAIVHFAALALGTSPLDPLDVLLAEPFGVPLATDAIHGATIEVVPEAATGALLFAALAALAGARRARRI